jgi:hypothetical protein
MLFVSWGEGHVSNIGRLSLLLHNLQVDAYYVSYMRYCCGVGIKICNIRGKSYVTGCMELPYTTTVEIKGSFSWHNFAGYLPYVSIFYWYN